jgi:hypothetical protein
MWKYLIVRVNMRKNTFVQQPTVIKPEKEKELMEENIMVAEIFNVI